jgi:hypothetical protein
VASPADEKKMHSQQARMNAYSSEVRRIKSARARRRHRKADRMRAAWEARFD